MSRKGFTLVELMVVILIVAILAAVAIPIMRGRIDSAKWSEGKAMMGTIATAIRAYCAETDTEVPSMAALDFEPQLGFRQGDLEGTYFTQTDFVIQSGDYDPAENVISFIVQATKGDASGINGPDIYTLDQDGQWVQSDL